ncbi:MAG: hypothetical protein KGR17_09365, partial [Acidobacteria bacterium]|nr:hypothetical protein [Acidobacteriota bacterium]
RRVRCGRRALSALAVVALGLGTVSAAGGPAGAAMPSTTPDEGTTTNISATFSPTTNLAPGDVVAGSITTTDGFQGYEVKLCKPGLTGYSLTNFGYSTSAGVRCVKQNSPGGISSGGLDASLTAGIQAPTYWIPTVAGSNSPETRTFSFTVGTGTVEWYNTDGFGPESLTCGPSNPCDMVVRVSHGGSTSWYIQPLTYVASPPATGGAFIGIEPTRALDTRRTGPCVGTAGRTLTLAGQFGLPADAAAVALNVTVVEPSGPGFLTVWPNGLGRPEASNLNFTPGQVVPNMVQVKLGASGAIQMYASNGCPSVVVDVTGYYTNGEPFPSRRASGATRTATGFDP